MADVALIARRRAYPFPGPWKPSSEDAPPPSRHPIRYDDLPPLWRATLDTIAGARHSTIGILCLPGGGESVSGLIAIGAVARVRYNRKLCTLTPWGAAELMGVGLWEDQDEGEPRWTRLDWIQAQEDAGVSIKSKGERGMTYLPPASLDIDPDDIPKVSRKPSTRKQRRAERKARLAAANARRAG